MKQDGMSDSEFLRSLAYNDYNIDGHLLGDGDRLCVISDRLELFEKTIECLRSERDEARRMASLQSCMGDDEPREWSPEDFAKQHGWDCFKEDGNAN
jgi:hypothetical protein